MESFSFSTTRKIIAEVGITDRFAEICSLYSSSILMIVTDKGIVNSGILAPVLTNLESAGIAFCVYDSVESDPSDKTVLNASELAKNEKVDLVVGFGGGSPMDVAKLVSVLAHPSCTTRLHDFYGVEKIKEQRLSLIQVPTTAGTGSEVTPISIVTTGDTTKAGIVSNILQPDLAVLDANLTLGLPAQITAATGIDAMVHAIEAYTSKIRKNPISDMLAIKALQLLSGNIQMAVHDGQDVEARSNMLLGATLAGQAFANAPVAAVHALAYPLGGHFHIPHGLSNSLVLPHVMRFNSPKAADLYSELAPIIMGQDYVGGSQADICIDMIKSLEWLIYDLGLPNKLRDCGVKQEDLPLLAKEAMLQQRLLVNNLREVTEQDALAIYQSAF